MREPTVKITCDLCFYPANEDSVIFQVAGKDICSHCANIIQRAQIFDLTAELCEKVKAFYEDPFNLKERNDS